MTGSIKGNNPAKFSGIILNPNEERGIVFEVRNARKKLSSFPIGSSFAQFCLLDGDKKTVAFSPVTPSMNIKNDTVVPTKANINLDIFIPLWDKKNQKLVFKTALANTDSSCDFLNVKGVELHFTAVGTYRDTTEEEDNTFMDESLSFTSDHLLTKEPHPMRINQGCDKESYEIIKTAMSQVKVTVVMKYKGEELYSVSRSWPTGDLP